MVYEREYLAVSYRNKRLFAGMAILDAFRRVLPWYPVDYTFS